jgi:hypothetical protein
MLTARTTIPQYQESIPSLGMTVRTANPGRRLGWCQRIRQWRMRCAHVGHRREVSQQLYDHLWDPQHEQVWERTADSPWDFVVKHSPGLRSALYYHLAQS